MKEMILKFWKRWFGKEAAGQAMPAKWGRHFRAVQRTHTRQGNAHLVVPV